MRSPSDRLTLGLLLAALPVFCILAMVAVGLVVRGGMKDISARLAEVNQTSIPRYARVIDLSAAMSDAHTKALRGVMLAAAGLPADRVTQLTNEALAAATRVGVDMASFPSSTEANRALTQEIRSGIERYRKSLSDAVDLIDDPALASGGFRKADQDFLVVRQKLDAFAAAEKTAFTDSISASDREAGNISWTFFITLAVCIAFVGAGVALISRAIALPIKRITAVMASLAEGNLSVAIPFAGRRDDIGCMAQTLQVFRNNLAETEEMRAAQSQTEARQVEQRRAEMMRLADNFESTVGNIVRTLGEAAAGLTQAAEQLSTAADKTSSQATEVTAASEQASHNVSTVAAATEELSASVREIEQQITRSGNIIEKAATEARQTTQQVQDLSQAAAQIDSIVSLINDIASQTNLLALNATIEAARAGEAGKGFAVVASEVKNLATQTAKATADITTRIKGVQDLTRGTTVVIGSIAETIAEVNDISGSISSAVTEQGAATSDIARNIDQAARGSAKVAESIGNVHVVAEHSSTSATQVLNAARDLSRHSETLRQEINAFLNRVRAA